MRFQTTYFLLILLIQGATLSAQVVINEYSAANWQQFYDNHNDHEDWIELYNAGNSAANLSGYWLSDDDNEPKKFQFPVGTTIASKGFLTIWCSGRNKVEDGFIHANFRLTQTKNTPETIVLSTPSGNSVDQREVAKTFVHQSNCRTTDGATSWKICSDPTPSFSNNGTPQYKSIAKKVDADKSAGFYAGTQTITLSTAEPDALIRYTLDGTEPTDTSAIYTSPINISSTTVLKARTYSGDPEILPGFIRFNTYFIDEDFTMPVFSVAANELQTLANGQKELRPIGSIEYFGVDKDRKNASYGELNSHGQDSWQNDQRSLDWISRDEMGYSRAITEPLFNYSQRDEYQRIIFRAAGDDNYPATDADYHEGSCHLRDDYAQSLAKLGGMSLDTRASERCIVFLNGAYWGVYSIRENPDDHDYTEYTYDQGKYDIQCLLTWGDTRAKYGGEQAFDDWNQLRNFILTNDMSVAENYKVASDSIDMTSLIDYFIVNLNTVASDWLNYNTGWWRGLNPAGGHKKWGYLLWDLDATFNYYINYSGVPNTNYNADPCDVEQISDYVQNAFFGGSTQDTCITEIFPPDTFTYCVRVDGKHQLILLKLLEESPVFRQLYYARQSDMMNTVFSCENMLQVFDSMVAVIAPEMPRHIQRWGGSVIEWKQNIAKMRNFITLRCGYLEEGMTNCYTELSGPYPLTILVEPPGAGTVDFNTLSLKTFPWTGDYFGGMEQTMRAQPTGTLAFNHWESKSGNLIQPNPSAQAATIELIQGDTLIAVFGVTSTNDLVQNHFNWQVFPTIATDFVQVSYDIPNAKQVQISLLSALGQQVATWNATTGQQQQRLPLQDKGLAPGVYFLVLEADGLQQYKKIVIQTK